MVGLLVGRILVKSYHLHSINRFCGHKIGIGSLPTPWQGCTVKVHKQLVFCGIIQNVNIVLDHALAIATEEINLDPFNTHRLKTTEFIFPSFFRQQFIFRMIGNRVPIAG